MPIAPRRRPSVALRPVSLAACLGASIAVFGLAGATGCDKVKEKISEKVAEKITEKAIESQTGGSVDIERNGEKITFVGKDGKGTMQVGGGKVPGDFPKSVPVYPGAKVAASWTSSKGDKTAHVLTLESDDAPDKVVGYYKANLATLEKKFEMNSGDMSMLQMKDAANKIDLAVTVTKRDAGSAIQLIATDT